MARIPKPTAKASLSIYSTRKEKSGTPRSSLELSTGGSPGKLSSSQSTSQEIPSDETNHRRASTSSSLSSFESTDNTSFITLKYSPPSRKPTNALCSAPESAHTSPSKLKSAEVLLDDSDTSRTRSARNRKLTGKALDLAVSGKLYKSENVQNSKDPCKGENRGSGSLRSSPLPSSQSQDGVKGVQQKSRSQSRDGTASPGKDATRLEAPILEGLAVDSIQDAAAQASIIQSPNSDTRTYVRMTPSRKRRKVEDTVVCPNGPAAETTEATGIEQSEKPSDVKDADYTSKLSPPRRRTTKSHKGRDSLAGQASLRSTRQRVKRSQLDETKSTTNEFVAPDPVSIDSTPAEHCSLDCLHESDIFLALAESILNSGEDETEETNYDQQSHRNPEEDLLVTEAYPKLKTYCRCGIDARHKDAASTLGDVGNAGASSQTLTQRAKETRN